VHKLQYEINKERAGLNGVNRGPLTEADQVFVKDGERCWFVKLSEIRLFESVGNYAKVFFANNKPLILKSLNSLEERLDDHVFFPCQQETHYKSSLDRKNRTLF
jgi:two-component system LytT family response regulator